MHDADPSDALTRTDRRSCLGTLWLRNGEPLLRALSDWLAIFVAMERHGHRFEPLAVIKSSSVALAAQAKKPQMMSSGDPAGSAL